MDTRDLAGVWYHSYEEDRDDRLVFRPGDFDFPRSRAPRRSLSIDADGIIAVSEPGPADAGVPGGGTWDAARRRLTLTGSGRPAVYEVEAGDDAVLILRPSDGDVNGD